MINISIISVEERWLCLSARSWYWKTAIWTDFNDILGKGMVQRMIKWDFGVDRDHYLNSDTKSLGRGLCTPSAASCNYLFRSSTWLPGIGFTVEFSCNYIFKQLAASNTVTEHTNNICMSKSHNQICRQIPTRCGKIK